MSPAAKTKRARIAAARPTHRAAAAEDDAEHALKEIVAAMTKADKADMAKADMAKADMAKADHSAENGARRLQPKRAKNRQ